MAKYKRKTSTKRNTPWTEEDRAYLRHLMSKGTSTYEVAELLDRSIGAIQQQVYLMRQHETAARVAETHHEPRHETQDDKLKAFRLFEGFHPTDTIKPTLIQRIRNFFRK